MAQNADVHSEQVSLDMMLLRSIQGHESLGSYAVWPQSVQTLRKQVQVGGSAFGAYVSDYYGHVIPSSGYTNHMEVGQVDSRFRGLDFADTVARLQGDLAIATRIGVTADAMVTDPFVLAIPSVRLMGSITDNLGFFLDLSNGARLAGNPMMIAKADPSLSRITKFTTEDSAFFDRYTGYLQFQSEYFRVRIGREPLQFGFSPIDNLVHSINAPMLDGLLIDIPYKAFRFTSTHSAAVGVDTAGKAVPSKFIATHRLAVDPTPWLSLAVNDMIVYWGRGVDFAYLNPLAFFVSAGLSTQERSENDNSMLSFDFAIRPVNGTVVYGTWFIDDLNYSTIGDTSYLGNTNKWAWQIGLSQSIVMAGFQSLISAEYVRIDPFTYTHRSLNASYTSFQAPIGYAMQPNSDRVAAQLRTWFSPRTFIRFDLDYTRHGENILDSTGNILMGENPHFPGAISPIGNVGGDILRGDGDDLYGNRFLRGNVSHQRRIQIWFSTEWMPNIFTDVRVAYTSRNGGNSPDRFFSAAIDLRVGY